MDPTQLLTMLSGVFSGTGPNGLIVGILIVVVLQWLKVKYPETLKWLPNLVKLPAASDPAPQPAVPSPAADGSTGHPILDALLGVMGKAQAAIILAQELHRSVAQIPPEPTVPVAAGRSGKVSMRMLAAFGLCFAITFSLIELDSLLTKSSVAAAAPVVSAAADDASPRTSAIVSSIGDDDIPAGHRILYRLSRDKAAHLYAKEHKVTVAEARESLAKVSDGSLHAALKASKIKVGALPIADRLEDVLRWIVDHKDLILEVAKLLLALLALL